MCCDEQYKNLDRVKNNLGTDIIEFAEAKYAAGAEFHNSDLLEYVLQRHPNVSPNSPLRILAHLRQTKILDYKVINRRQSLFKITRV